MFKASLPSSQTSGFLKRLNYNTWTRIVGDIVAVTSLVLQDHGTRQVVDWVTIIRGYAELSVMYPNIREYHERLSASLLRLSETLRAYGDLTYAAQLKSLNDCYRKFAGAALAADDGLHVQQNDAELQTVMRGKNA